MQVAVQGARGEETGFKTRVIVFVSLCFVQIVDKIWAVVWGQEICGIMACGLTNSEMDWSLFSALI